MTLPTAEPINDSSASHAPQASSFDLLNNSSSSDDSDSHSQRNLPAEVTQVLEILHSVRRSLSKLAVKMEKSANRPGMAPLSEEDKQIIEDTKKIGSDPDFWRKYSKEELADVMIPKIDETGNLIEVNQNVIFKPLQTSAPSDEKQTEEEGAGDSVAADQVAEEKESKEVLYSFVYSGAANTVEIIGSFNDWQRAGMDREDDKFVLKIPLASGSYEFKYIADGVYLHDPTAPTKDDGHGGLNNVLKIE